MATRRGTELVVDQKFDRKNCRHLLNGTTYVLHCHHYATLYCRLADDAEIFDGRALLRKACEESFLPELKKALALAEVDDLGDRVKVVEDYYRFVGLGLLRFEKVGSMAASAVMEHSHVDQGWIKKWGQREAPVNFIGQGYLSAALAAIYDAPAGSFKVEEQQSIVAGAEASLFTIVRR